MTYYKGTYPSGDNVNPYDTAPCLNIHDKALDMSVSLLPFFLRSFPLPFYI